MKDSEISFGEEMDTRIERKRELTREIVKIKDSLHTLRKQKLVDIYKPEIERLEAELKEMEAELAVLEQIKY